MQETTMTQALHVFTDAYIACALWSSTDNSRDDGGDPLDKNYGREDIAPSASERMAEDCEKFYTEQEQLIAGDYTQAGHDFWLTRNGHGAGFWDGDWPKGAGEILTEASKAFGECNIYIGDDGLLYLA